MSFLFAPTPQLVSKEDALPGRSEPILNPRPHAVLGTPITGPWKEGQRSLLVALGCFWGHEKMYWETEGVESTSVGYAAAPPRTQPILRSAVAKPITLRL